mmetsp:Transcript_5568/g.7792  ORF Transcript_5568/g.7792 Transcript_5568/m.7792 type:complete len:250 (-) Transcript_5568:88-837(-)
MSSTVINEEDQPLLRHANGRSKKKVLTSLTFWRSILAELIGTFIFMSIGFGAIVSCGGQTVLVITAFAGCLAGLILALERISGAHFNPAVSFAFLLNGELSVVQYAFYALAQLSGASLAAAMTHEGFSNDLVSENYCSGVAVSYDHDFPAFILETFMTFNLVFVIFLVGVSHPRAKEHSFITPLIVAGTLASNIAFGAVATGASLNPARAFGPALFCTDHFKYWVYWISPFLGSALGLLCSKVISKEDV